MTLPPAHIIRNYLDEHDGEAEVPFHNLLTTWGFDEIGPATRVTIERELHAAGVVATPSLQWVGPDTLVTLRLAQVAPTAPPPWAGARPPEAQPEPSGRAGRGALVALACALLLLAAGGAVAGYLLGRDSGTDLAAAKAQGVRQGERLAAQRRDPAGVRRARAAGRREGYRRAYQPAFDSAKGQALAAAPKSCGDARSGETPTLTKVRAEGVDCPTALSLVRGCQNPEAGCQGYSCDAVSIAWEASEVTCTSGGRTIRFITAV